MIQGFTAQIALGVFYSSTFPVFLSQAASPAGLALNPIPSLSLMSGFPHLIYLTFHFVPSFVHVHASPAVTYSLSLVARSPDCLLHSAVLGSFSSPCWWNQEMQNIQCEVDTEWLKLGKVIENWKQALIAESVRYHQLQLN